MTVTKLECWPSRILYAYYNRYLSFFFLSMMVVSKLALAHFDYSTRQLLSPHQYRYQVTFPIKAQVNGKKPPRFFCLRWHLNLRPHGSSPTSLTNRAHPWVIEPLLDLKEKLLHIGMKLIQMDIENSCNRLNQFEVKEQVYCIRTITLWQHSHTTHIYEM